jgi:hypothetical protein
MSKGSSLGHHQLSSRVIYFIFTGVLLIFNCFSFQVAMSSRLLFCASLVPSLITVHLIAGGQGTQKTILVVLDGLANILAAAGEMDEPEKVSLHVEDCGVVDCIEDLQSHENNEIYYKLLAILEQYFLH